MKPLIYISAAFTTLLIILGVIIAQGSGLNFLNQIEPSPLVQFSTPSPAPATGTPITVTGTMICLPKKDTTGPQTMECAYGLKTANGNYGLHDSDPNYSNIMNLQMNVDIRVTGTFKPDTTTLYDSLGVIELTKIEEL